MEQPVPSIQKQKSSNDPASANDSKPQAPQLPNMKLKD